MEDIHIEELHNEAVENGEEAMNELEQMEAERDYPLNVLELFKPTKKGVIDFASNIINGVEEGRINPLRVKQLAKCLEEIAEKINEGTKEFQVKEAAKWGDKPFMLQGSEFHLTATHTKYDYSKCNDPVWNRLNEMKSKITKHISDREEFLKTVHGYVNVVDEDSGEECKISPPLKKQTEGVKITLK